MEIGRTIAQVGAMAEARIAVGIVITSFDPGGTERQMTELIARLDRQRFDVHVACFRKEGRWLDRVVSTVHDIAEFRLAGFASPNALRQAQRFVRWCRRARLSVVHACDYYANVFALPSAAVAGVPVRLGSRRDLVLPGRSAAHHLLQKTAYRAADRVVANSAAAAAQVVAEGVAADRVVIIPNGIDVTRYRARTPPDVPVITTVANLRGEKGHDVLLQAASHVLQRTPAARFQIVGGGPLHSALEAQAHALGVAHAVRFLGHREDIPDLLADSSVFVLPSRSEAFPNAVVEAMAAGLPVVGSDVGGIPELVKDGVNGLLVSAGDPVGLADAIGRLLNRPAEAAAYGRTARETIEARYSFHRMVGAFEALYTQRVAARLSNSLPISSHLVG